MKVWQIVVLALVVVAAVWIALDKKKVDSSEVMVEDTNLPKLIELGSHGCKACEEMKPVLAQLEKECSDQLTVKFFDVRTNPEIAKKYKIRLIPTQIFEDSEGNEIFRHEGYYSKDEILKIFKEKELIQ